VRRDHDRLPRRGDIAIPVEEDAIRPRDTDVAAATSAMASDAASAAGAGSGYAASGLGGSEGRQLGRHWRPGKSAVGSLA
jgi:hypothetical protein